MYAAYAGKEPKTVYAHGKLVATMNDRMDNNFYCLKMVSAGAMVGAIVGAAAAAELFLREELP